MKVCSAKYYLLLFAILQIGLPTMGQVDYTKDYVPKQHYSRFSFDLIRSITIQGGQQILGLDENEQHMDEYFASTTLDLIELVKKDKFIDDDSLKAFLHGIIKKINYNNSIKVPRRILVLRSELVNAYSLGEGTLIVSNGLLSQIDNEQQLAFIIAHEMAHWELDHFKQKINKTIDAESAYNPGKELKKIDKGSFSIEGIRNIKSWHYDRKRFSRQVEYQADSLAVELYKNAFSEEQQIVFALNELDSGFVQGPYLGARVFKDLNFKKYPFRKEWAVIEKETYIDPTSYSLLHPDSSLTHPEIEMRIELIEKLLGQTFNGTQSFVSDEYYKIKTDALFENIEACYINQNWPLTLYYALRLKQEFPENAYLTEMITTSLLQVYYLKKSKELEAILKDTTGYNMEQKYVYNFLINIEAHELAEVIYHFINKKGNFNREDEDHYMLLFDACRITDRQRIQTMVKNRYLENFEDGKYLERMVEPAN